MTAKHLLDQIVRSLDGVTAGPWVIDGDPDRAYLVYTDDRTGSLLARLGGSGFEFVPRSKVEIEATAAHMSRCDPDTMREIAAYVRETEARATAAEATVTALQKALRVAEGALSVLYDNREQAGAGAFVIQLTVDEMTTVRRARTALTTIRRTDK